MEASAPHSRHRCGASPRWCCGFIFNVLRGQQLPELLLPDPEAQLQGFARPRPVARRQKPAVPRAAKPTASPLKSPSTPAKDCAPPTTCRTTQASYSSFKEHVHQIDMLFPQWLHVDAPRATLLAISSDSHREYPVIEGDRGPRSRRPQRVKRVIQASQGRHRNLSPPQQLQLRTPKAGIPASATCSRIRHKRTALRQQIVRFLHRVSRPIAASRSTLRAFHDDASPGLSDLHPGALRRHAPAQPAPLCQRGRRHPRRRSEAHRRQLRRHRS